MSVPGSVIAAAINQAAAANVAAATEAGPFDHLVTPDATVALREHDLHEQQTLQWERAGKTIEKDVLEATNRCDGCHVVSPRARECKIDGLGFGCVDCASLAVSPYRPKSWTRDTLDVDSSPGV